MQKEDAAEKITNLKENNTSIVYFKDDGIYRIIYQLCDKDGNVLTEDFVNFIVKTN